MTIFTSFLQAKEFLKLDQKQLRYIGGLQEPPPQPWQGLPDVNLITVNGLMWYFTELVPHTVKITTREY